MRRNLFILIILILILLGGFVLYKSIKTTKKTNIATKQAAPLPSKQITIKLDKNGFSPKEVTVKTGTAVRWRNVSGAKQTVNSDDYPTNQLHRELNFGVFNNDSSVAHIFKNEGTYGYHNQFNPEQSGKIIVIK